MWTSFPELTLIRVSMKNCDDQIPLNKVREHRPSLILRPKKRFPILLNCEKQQFVSCTSHLLEQRYDFQKRTMFLQKWISNLQDFPQSQSLETVPACIV